MLRRGLISSCTIVAVAQLHCGGNVSSEPPATPQEAFVNDYTNAVCDRDAKCCTVAGLATDDPRCRSQNGTAYSAFVTSESAKGRTFNAQAAARCLEEIAGAAPCDPNPHAPSCGLVFTGNAGEGDRCIDPADCKYRSNSVTYCTKGVCAYAPIARLGERCGGSGVGACESPLRCTLSGATDLTCTPRGTVGASCREFADCEFGLYCDSATGSCAKGRAYGEPCDMDPTVCATGSCDSTARSCSVISLCKR